MSAISQTAFGSEGFGGKLMRTTGGRTMFAAALFAAMAIALAGCHLHDHGSGPGGASGVHVVAPAGRSQAAASGEVPVNVRVDRDLDASSLRVWVVTGASWHPSRHEITSRLVRDASGATALLHAADLQPGLTTIEAVATRRSSWRDHHEGTEEGVSTFSWEPAVDLSTANRCDVLAPVECLMPFPNDFFTVADSSTPTGRRVHIDPASMNANSSGVRVNPAEWNRNDGFSPGSMIVTYVPNVDLVRSGVAPITDIGASLRPDQPIVLLDTNTGRRWPFFAELDAQSAPTVPRALIIRPAKNLIEGHRYVVAMRDLRDASGAILPATRGFQLYRDRIPTFSSAIESRRPHLERVFADAEHAGIRRDDLYVGLGLHRRERAEPRRPDAAHP